MFSEMLSFKEDVTFTHPTRNFRYTIPAGWGISLKHGDNRASNDPKTVDHDDPSFQSRAVEGKKIGPCSFGITIEPMVKSHPRGAAVAAGLKRDRERIEIKQVLEAKRRDQGDPKKKCSFIGWQTYEAPRRDPSNNRHIFYQGYDQDNVLYVFNTGSEDRHFEMCKADFMKIIESVKFCIR